MDHTEQGNEISKRLSRLLHGLDRTTLTYFVADMYQLQGWDVEIHLGKSSIEGDLVLSQYLPYPRSVNFYIQVDKRLEKKRLEDVLNRTPSQPATAITILVHEQPTTEALEFATNNDIGIVGVADLVDEIVSYQFFGFVAEFLADDDHLASEYAELLEELRTADPALGAPTTDSTETCSTADEQPENPRERPLAENRQLSLGLIGYDTCNRGSEETGILLAVKITAKESIEITPESCILEFKTSEQRQPLTLTNSTLLTKSAGVLSSEWSVGETSLTAGTSTNYLVYIDQATDLDTLEALYLSNLRLPLQPPTSSQTYRGLPGPIADVLSTVLECDLTQGHQEHYLSYGLDGTASRAQLRENSRKGGSEKSPISSQGSAAKQPQEASGETKIVAESAFLTLELLDIAYITMGKKPGMLVAIKVSARGFDIEFNPHSIVLQTADGETYEGVGKRSAGILDHISESVGPIWVTEKLEISAGSSRKCLVFVPASEEFDAGRLRYQAELGRLLTMSWEQIETQTGRSSDDEIIVELEYTPEQMQNSSAFPAAAKKLLDSPLANRNQNPE